MDAATDKLHDVERLIGGWFSVNDNAVYVYDSTQTPSGLVFNVEDDTVRTLARLDTRKN